jgi:hypothetical protein
MAVCSGRHMTIETFATDADTDLADLDIAGWCTTVVEHLRALMDSSQLWSAYLRKCYLPALSEFSEIKLSNDLGDSGFKIKDDVFFLNPAPLISIFKEIEKSFANSSSQDSDTIPTKRAAIALFLLHELRHPAQGVGRFSTIQKIKKLSGPKAVSEIDIEADMDAATTYTIIQTNGLVSLDTIEFNKILADALFVIGIYSTPAFDFGTRLHKIERAIALALSCARLTLLIEIGAERQFWGNAPKNAPISVVTKEQPAALIVTTNNPDRTLLMASTDELKISDLKRAIIDNDFCRCVDLSAQLIVDSFNQFSR